MTEIWKEIKGAKEYFISNLGRVKGMRGKIMRLAKNRKGYLVCRIPNRKYSQSVHRVVATHFIPNPLNLPQVNHIDGRKLNNHHSNLEYVTCKENINHAIKTGLRIARANIAQDMFDTTQVKVIKHALREGFKGIAIAKYFKCHDSTISKINVGINYAHISI